MRTSSARGLRLFPLFLVGMVMVSVASAGPDSGSFDGSSATFSGNQSQGILCGVDFQCPPICHIDVQNLLEGIGTATNPLGYAAINMYHTGTNGANRGDQVTGFSRASTGGYGQAGQDISATLHDPFGIAVDANDSPAVCLRSTGGNGGKGANGWGTIITPGLGGHGGMPGAGGNIGITTRANVKTWGSNNPGLMARSQGGKGGDGGGGYTGIYVSGGNGAPGGVGGTVNINQYESIDTYGYRSMGIVAESLGGASGAGGAGGGLFGGSGAGSDSGRGGYVSVNSLSAIRTCQEQAHAVYAQSVGGYAPGAGGGGGLVFWGGSGGSSGDGGEVVVLNNAGSWRTDANDSCGALAMSIGGGGGSAGATGGLVGLGGSGSAGGHGGLTQCGNNGLIETFGDGSCGMEGMSIGGGGGSSRGSGGIVSVGGDGKSTGNGGEVRAWNYGTIRTAGAVSDALHAQSIGGGGGTAGDAGGIFAMGGSGSASGHGGTIQATNTGVIGTTGVASCGILGQSIGGGGGSGGGSGGVIALGGSAQSTGNGGFVVIENRGTVHTEGNEASCLAAQSIGGGGGRARNSGGVVSLGGDGGSGGDGGDIQVLNYGLLISEGEYAYGLFAQSLGGGGGTGGGSGAAIAIGGNGSAQGDGKYVVAQNNGRISTIGSSSACAFLQSVGGGGGTDVKTGIDRDEQTGPGGQADSVLVAIGGKAGSGGSGGRAYFEQLGFLASNGFHSPGALVQSVGGGGGTGGGAFDVGIGLAFSVGGDSSLGGNGGSAEIQAADSSNVTTVGDYSPGLHVQSIGGGGGSGGNACRYTLGIQFECGASLGGKGGGGGHADKVVVENSGSVYTYGCHSSGLVGQSIGGGGGSGGNAASWHVNIGLPLEQIEIPALSVGMSLGGEGGQGGNGGTVRVVNRGRIATRRFASHGLLAQSVGGGGGVGGDSFDCSATIDSMSMVTSVGGRGGQGGSGSQVDCTSIGALSTSGDFAFGLLAQSVGGGGGTGGDSTVLQADISTMSTLADVLPGMASVDASFSLGGRGGGGNHGGTVNAAVPGGSITTSGCGSHGLLAQSIGGGGGAGGDSLSVDLQLSGNPLDYLEFLGYLVPKVNVSLGGGAGTGGNGQAVGASNSASVVTKGDFAVGLMAQSIGGGGGAGGVAVHEDALGILGSSGSAMVLHGISGGTGEGGTVTLSNDGVVETAGAFAPGILAQSIGGGGGFAAISEHRRVASLAVGPLGAAMDNHGYGVAFAGSAGGSGSAGAVTVDHTGSITTAGDCSHGILAQSIAGHVGNCQDVRVVVDGDVIATGADAHGIWVQRHGSGNGGALVEILGGVVMGGSGMASAVKLESGSEADLVNHGLIKSTSGVALIGDNGNDRIDNAGTILGDVLLGGGENSLRNQGALHSGTWVELSEGALENHGLLSPGGAGQVVTTTVIGDLMLGESGVIEIDVAGLAPGQCDALIVTGEVGLCLPISPPSDGSPTGGELRFLLAEGFDIASAIGPGETFLVPFADSPQLATVWPAMKCVVIGGPEYFEYELVQSSSGTYCLEATNTIPCPPMLLLVASGAAVLLRRRR